MSSENYISAQIFILFQLLLELGQQARIFEEIFNGNHICQWLSKLGVVKDYPQTTHPAAHYDVLAQI